MEIPPTAQPRKRRSNPVSSVLVTPQQASNATSSGLRGEPAKAGKPIDECRSQVGQSRKLQWLVTGNGASHRHTDTQRIANQGNSPTGRLPHTARALRGAHLPDTAATAQAALRPQPKRRSQKAREGTCNAMNRKVKREVRPREHREVQQMLLRQLSRPVHLPAERPAVQPAVAYGQCITGNDGVRSAPTMYPLARGPESARTPVDSASYTADEGLG